MALIKCPECGKEISDKAPSCPQCGVPLGFKSNPAIRQSTTKDTDDSAEEPKLQSRLGVGLLAFVVISVVAIVVVIKLANSPPSPPSNWTVMDAGKFSIRKRAKDPDSVTFGDVWVGTITSTSSSTKVACGYFNAKNSFGGYTGEQRFISGADMPMTDDDSKVLIDAMWQETCVSGRVN